MSSREQTFRNISDTAIWAAIYRGRENERPNGLFRDPFATRLAGERGRQIAGAMKSHDRYEWAWIMRTVLFDRFIAEEVAQDVDMVVNLAAGLDTRPYRMALPPTLRWIEVDFPPLIDYKEEILRKERPGCALERVRLDLADEGARRDLFRRLAGSAKRALVVTEGLLIYLTPEQAGSLARDLAAPPAFQRWVFDLASPGLLRLLQRQVGAALDAAAAPLKFAPAEGPAFFESYGWKTLKVRTPFKEASRTKRLPLFLRLFALFPERDRPRGKQIWSGVCLMEKSGR
ncbi:MAG TPA: class I SAM-dependent methyltransferase [Thermoanaerobaculia bacterium]|jgi:methyltransferase (TIGR00027 family)